MPWIAAFALFLICASFFGYGFLSLLFTSLVLIISNFLFAFSLKKNHVLVEKLEQNEAIISSEENSPVKVEEAVSKLQPESETISHNEEEETQEENGPEDLYSEIESIDQSFPSEDSDVGWPYSGEAGRSPDLSDGSISDEESLIEIAIPSGQYVSRKEEEKYPKLCLPLQHKLPSFSAEDIFGQHGLKELLAEYNEEENLIEIDLSMGSIKCSRFEIKA